MLRLSRGAEPQPSFGRRAESIPKKCVTHDVTHTARPADTHLQVGLSLSPTCVQTAKNQEIPVVCRGRDGATLHDVRQVRESWTITMSGKHVMTQVDP